MTNTLRITYHYNSGFSIHLGTTLLIFDYWEGDGDCANLSKLSMESLGTYERIYVFVTTSRSDHVDSVIYQWQQLNNVKYITSDDVDLQPNTQYIRPGQTIVLEDDIRVKAYPSTDKGVSLMISLANFNIFYAGNFNLWHWREHDTLENIEQAQEDFRRILFELQDKDVSVAFFPLDPRQGLFFEAGAVQYIMKIRPKFFIPMHFTYNPDVVATFARDNTYSHTVILPMEVSGTIANIERIERGFRSTMITPNEALLYTETILDQDTN